MMPEVPLLLPPIKKLAALTQPPLVLLCLPTDLLKVPAMEKVLLQLLLRLWQPQSRRPQQHLALQASLLVPLEQQPCQGQLLVQQLRQHPPLVWVLLLTPILEVLTCRARLSKAMRVQVQGTQARHKCRCQSCHQHLNSRKHNLCSLLNLLNHLNLLNLTGRQSQRLSSLLNSSSKK
jgi:hypothetical protein